MGESLSFFTYRYARAASLHQPKICGAADPAIGNSVLSKTEAVRETVKNLDLGRCPALHAIPVFILRWLLPDCLIFLPWEVVPRDLVIIPRTYRDMRKWFSRCRTVPMETPGGQ